MAVTGVATTQGLSPLHPVFLPYMVAVRRGRAIVAEWGGAAGLDFRRFGLYFHPCTPGAILLLGFSSLSYKVGIPVYSINFLC